MESVKSKAVAVGAIYAVDLVCVVVFGVILGWL